MVTGFDFTAGAHIMQSPLSLTLPNVDTIVNYVDMKMASDSAPSLPKVISTIALVTASDMVPFIPCQPLAISLGSQMGIYALPICVIGQTSAGMLAFRAARIASDSKELQRVLDSLDDKARQEFESFRKLGSTDVTDDKDTESQFQKESKVLLALIGLRLAPFFPFSAGNYLLGGATGVSIRPFFIATIFGCILSNILSIGVGMGGSELFDLVTNN